MSTESLNKGHSEEEYISAEKGCCLADGPHHKMSWRWFFGLPGIEYVQLYLWLAKDWSWSQLSWFWSAMIFGTAALGWMTFTFCAAMYLRLYSEAYIAVGVFLWLLANYTWMTGNLLVENKGYPGTTYDNGYYAARWMFIAASVWLFGYLVSIPFQWFKADREKKTVKRMNSTSPPPRFMRLFHEYREYEAVHFFFWALKDTIWIWEEPGYDPLDDVGGNATDPEYDPSGYVAGNMDPQYWPYAIVYAMVIILSFDLLILLASYKRQFIDFAHMILVTLWVIANGIWALGEIGIPSREFGEMQTTDEEWEAYVEHPWPNRPDTVNLYPRWIVGSIFCTCFCILGVFYLLWIYVSCFTDIPTYQESLQQDYIHAGIMTETNFIKPEQSNNSNFVNDDRDTNSTGELEESQSLRQA